MIQLRAARTLVSYILATALRDRLFLAFLVLTALAAWTQTIPQKE